MSIEEFIDYLTDEYENSCNVRNEADTTTFWKEVMTYYSDSMLKHPLTKKNAARILNAFCDKVKHLPKVSWSKSGKLRDIYECRVCAEAIAQVYERGLINSSRDDIFGINDVLADEEIHEAVVKSLHMSS